LAFASKFILQISPKLTFFVLALMGSSSTTKSMEGQYFKMQHKILKNSLHGQIWSDFKKLSLEMSNKIQILSKCLLGKYPSHPGKTKITKVNNNTESSNLLFI
jgi:hypothetical protein